MMKISRRPSYRIAETEAERIAHLSASRQLRGLYQKTLWQVCAATDRAERLREAIDEDGEAIRGRNGTRANVLLRDELQTRAFICRTLKSLGLTLLDVKPIGRPSGRMSGWSGDD